MSSISRFVADVAAAQASGSDEGCAVSANEIDKALCDLDDEVSPSNKARLASELLGRVSLTDGARARLDSFIRAENGKRGGAGGMQFEQFAIDWKKGSGILGGKMGSRYELVTIEGKPILDTSTPDRASSGSVVCVQQGDRLRVFDSEGKEIFDQKGIGKYSVQGDLVVAKQGSKYRVIDGKGTQLFNKQADEVRVEGGIVVARQGTTYEVIDASGAQVLKRHNVDSLRFQDRMIVLQQGTRYRVYDAQQMELLDRSNVDQLWIESGLIFTRQGTHYRVFSAETGTLVLDRSNVSEMHVSGDYILARIGSHTRAFDRNGAQVSVTSD